MTGEITLRGRVWPISGLKEKLLAALRGGIKTVLIPEENAKDLVEISEITGPRPDAGISLVLLPPLRWHWEPHVTQNWGAERIEPTLEPDQEPRIDAAREAIEVSKNGNPDAGGSVFQG